MKSEFLKSISICVLFLFLGISCSDDKDDAIRPAISVSSDSFSNITWGGFTIKGKIIEEYLVTEVGFCYSDKNTEPTLDDEFIVATEVSDAEFSATLTGLSPATVYYVCGFLKYPGGVVYSQAFTVETAEAPVPIVKTLEVKPAPGTGGMYLAFSGEMIYDGPYEIVEKGFAYSLAPNPVIEDKFVIVLPWNDDGEYFVATIFYDMYYYENYHVRAYIKDEKRNIYYGNEVIF